MGSKICMNAICRTKTTPEWKRGWALRSGEFANLCYDCGYSYEKLLFCDTFHMQESGWRRCSLCRKRLHCGCAASKSLIELLDYGGVGCISCAKVSGLHSIRVNEISKDFGSSRENGSIVHFSNFAPPSDPPKCLPQTQNFESIVSLGQTKREDLLHIQEARTAFPDMTQLSVGPSKYGLAENSIDTLGVKDLSSAHASLSISLTPSLESSEFPSGAEGRGQSRVPSSFQQGQKPRHILPKPSKSGLATPSEINSKGPMHHTRVPRPPAEGRGRNQLITRYWPRITDQELQQLSGDLNSKIVPLFEKVLSASDAGRIGRLVLPKACAEAYFPYISQSEGLPLNIQDVKGKEWTFQFRFWPNNNSRMYVLEGVTPCIQSMQLQAGDTVTFSRIDPGGKLVMGFRKANSFDSQTEVHKIPPPNKPDIQTSCASTSAISGEIIIPGDSEKMSAGDEYSGLVESVTGSKDPHLNALSERLAVADGDVDWHRKENHGSNTNMDLLQQRVPKRRSRNIGFKSKRLLMHSEDALKLRVTWEEAQDFLRPPPNVKPSIVMVENHEFEEYDEPPVFGKRTIFTAQLSGEQEQWAQCDTCSKWRRLPPYILLPPEWVCSDNKWDSSRCSCSVPEEARSDGLEKLSGGEKDLKKRRIQETNKLLQDCEPSGLDALATAAVLGDHIEGVGEPSVGATTKHPRHRSGCTCIVCIQPPSGKGKHKSTCTCNVCMTVRRRFRTFEMRKKLRQSEQKTEITPRMPRMRDEYELDGTSGQAALGIHHFEDGRGQNNYQAEELNTATGQIDLNCDPRREEELQQEETETSLKNIVPAERFPLNVNMKQNGFTSINHEEQVSLDSSSVQRATIDSEAHLLDQGCLAQIQSGRLKAAGESRAHDNTANLT